MAKNTIKIKDYLHVVEEYEAVETINPGDLLEVTSDGKVKYNDGIGDSVLPMFASEDEFQGKGVDDAYQTGDRVQCWIPQRGDQVYANLKAGENIVVGDFLQSGGNGTVAKLTVPSTGANPGQIVGIALETLDLSASGMGNARLIIRIN